MRHFTRQRASKQPLYDQNRMVRAANALLLKQTTGMYAAAAVMPIAGIKRRGRQSGSRSSD